MSSNRAYYLMLFLVNGLFGMQASQDIHSKQKDVISHFISQPIDDQDILEAIKALDNLQLKEQANEAVKKNLDTALFRLTQFANGADAKRLAEILIKAGADPNTQFLIKEELSIQGKPNSHFSTTTHSFKTSAKHEAQGKLKEYLDSIK